MSDCRGRWRNRLGPAAAGGGVVSSGKPFTRRGRTILITYLRSSSYNNWSFCGWQYYLSYVLGLKPNKENGWITPKPQKKADAGNLVHKALELVARKKVALQNGEPTFSEGEIGKTWDASTFSVKDAYAESWDYYTKVRSPEWDWNRKDNEKCSDWFFGVLELNGGMWNPLNRDIIQPEQYFDFEIDRDWAKYSYPMPDGSKLEGRLAFKGTVDLLTRVSDDTLEYIDWKTGVRKDWATGKKKDWKALREDPQLRMYHYAIAKHYPQYRYIIMSIVWTQDGGAFSLDFGPKDLDKTERMMRARFETIRNCERPARILHDPKHNFKCQHMCAYGMNEWAGSGQTVCNYLNNELVSLGMDRVTKKYGNPEAFKSYGDGGGVTNRDAKK